MNRLTKKHKHTDFISYTDKKRCLKDYNIAEENVNKAIDKLGKLEDIMEKYNIKSLEELEKVISKGITYVDFIKSYWNEKGEKPNE